MSMDRRTFLAAAPLVFGIENLFGQDAAPGWIGEALRRMLDSGRFGLALVAPEADPLQRRVGTALWDLTRFPAARGLLGEAVFICALPAHAKAVGAKAGRLVLLSPAGAAIDSAPLATETIEDPIRFVATADALLRERRAARAGAIEKTLEDGLRGALDKLDAEDLETREEAFAEVAAAADRIAPLLAQVARSGRSEELRGRAKQALDRLYEKALENAPGPKLPYGARMPILKSAGCGGETELPEGAPENTEVAAFACGRARLPDGPPRRFLRFLSK